MRLRRLALPFAVAVPLAVFGAQQPAPLATPSPCLAQEVPVQGRGLDGGVGCVDPSKPESPAELMAMLAVHDGPRAGLDGADRLAALRHAQGLRAAAMFRRGMSGDFATPSGVQIPGSGNAWKALGPHPLVVNNPAFPGGAGYGNDHVNGRVAALLPDPRDPSGDTVYLGAAGGGVWKTTDAGDHWVSIGDPLPSQAVGALAIDTASGYLYAGLGEGNTGSDNYSGAGVVRTKDDGKTWSDPLPGIPAGVITTHIAVGDGRIFAGTQKGLFVSKDGGATFTKALLPTAGPGQESTKAFGNFVTDVRVQPGNANSVITAVGWRSGGLGGAAGLYRSSDAGDTFAKVGTATFGAASQSTDPIGRVSLAYADGEGQDHNVLYAVVQDAGKLNNEPFPLDAAIPAQANTNNLNGIYRSGDNGDTWTVIGTNQTLGAAPGSGISTTNLPGNGNYGAGVQAWYNNYIVVDPSTTTGTERVFVGLEEIYQGDLTAAGEPAAWKTVGRYWNACVQAVLVQLNCQTLGLPQYQGLTTHADQHAGAIAITTGGVRYYAGNDGGAYRQDIMVAPGPTGGLSNDSWTSLNDTLNTTMPYAAAMGHDGTVYTGLQDNGTAKIQPDGASYEAIGGDGFDVAIDPEDSDVGYEEYASGTFRVTNDGGVTWSGDVKPTGATGMRFSTPFELDPTDSAHMVYGASQVWETTDAPGIAGTSWTNVFDLTNAETAPGAASTAIDVQGDAAYAAWCGLPASPPAGASACNITTGDGNYDAGLMRRGIATNVANGCKAQKASTDCWHQAIASGLPNRFIQGIEIDPHNPKTVYVAMATFSRHWTYDAASLQPGVIFKSTDGGQSFKNISGSGSTALPETFGSDVLVVGQTLIAATDVGVFATPLANPGEWVPMGTGIPAALPAIDISTNPQGTVLVAATHGRGVWAMPLGKGPIVVPPKKPSTRPTKMPATGLPAAWALLALVPVSGAVLVRRRLRAARG
jgi:hypothetical protein